MLTDIVRSNAAHWAFYRAQIIIVLVLIKLFDLNLLYVLADLLCQKFTQLGPYHVLCIKLNCQLVRVVTFADQNVLIATFSDFDRKRQNLSSRILR